MMVTLGLQASFGLFFKPFNEEFGWNRTEISGAYSLAQIVYGATAILIGLLSDRFGPRRSVILCGTSLGLGCLLMSLVKSTWQIYLFYGVLFGIGNSIFIPLISNITKWFTQRRSMILGITIGGGGFGMLIVPPAINRSLNSYDWRWPFIILGILILLLIVLAAVILRKQHNPFVQVEPKENRPGNLDIKYNGISFKEAVRMNQFWLMCVVLISYSFAFVALDVHMVPYLTDIGISSAIASAVLTVIGGGTMLGQIVLGGLGDKIGNKKAYLFGLIMLTLGTLIVVVSREIWVFFVFAVLLGTAFGLAGTQSSPMTAWLFGLKSHGLFLGIFSFCFTVGASLGPLMFGYVFDATNSYRYAFWVAAALVIVSVILMALLKRTGTKSVPYIPLKAG
jgi:MFS family permease